MIRIWSESHFLSQRGAFADYSSLATTEILVAQSMRWQGGMPGQVAQSTPEQQYAQWQLPVDRFARTVCGTGVCCCVWPPSALVLVCCVTRIILEHSGTCTARDSRERKLRDPMVLGAHVQEVVTGMLDAFVTACRLRPPWRGPAPRWLGSEKTSCRKVSGRARCTSPV